MGIGTQFISFHHRGQESLTQQIIALIDRLLSLHQLRDQTSNTLPYVSLFAVVDPLRIVYDDIVILNSLLLIDVTVLLMGAIVD